jgi:hypothetical protein
MRGASDSRGLLAASTYASGNTNWCQPARKYLDLVAPTAAPDPRPWCVDRMLDHLCKPPSRALAERQGQGIVDLMRWCTPAEALAMATSANGELLALSGLRNP